MNVQTSGGETLSFSKDKAVDEHKNVLTDDVLASSGLTAGAYHSNYGRARPLFAPHVYQDFYDRVERKGNKSYHQVLKIGQIVLKAQKGEMKNRPTRPKGYRYPTKGKAGKAAERVARAFKYGRSIYLYGPAGTGKSDMFRALCHDLNIEFSLYPMREDLDTALYMGQMQVVIDPATGNNKTEYIPGRLLQDIQGRVGQDGKRRPVCIAFDDIDRGAAECHELLRHILDGAQEVFIPELGESIPVFPGTMIVATANSRGGGDDFGTYASVQTMDSSILDRFGRFIEYDYLDVDEEMEILREKYPYLQSNCQRSFESMAKVTETIRRMISSKELYIGFSHRLLTEWCESLTEIVQENTNHYSPSLLGEAAEDWLERFDEDVRKTLIERTLNAYISKHPF